MSIFLPHLRSAWHVDQAVLSTNEKLVVIRFGRPEKIECMQMDELLYKVAEPVRNFAVIYLCDIDEVSDFNEMYELWDDMQVLFFFRNQHMKCDFGTGDNNKLNFEIEDEQKLVDIIEKLYTAGVKGKRFTTM